MAGKIFRAGIRFNDEQFKYIKIEFNAESGTANLTVDIIINGVPTTITASIPSSQWVPVEDENESNSTLQATRATKTTAKKTVKESK